MGEAFRVFLSGLSGAFGAILMYTVFRLLGWLWGWFESRRNRRHKRR